MDTNPIMAIFFYGQLCCFPLSAEIKGLPNSSLPATFQPPATERIGLTTQPFRDRDTVKNQTPPVTAATPTMTAAQEKSQDGHVIGAVVIGIILVAMIVIIVSIFLWKRLGKTVLVDPHWAGRSPFADGDALEITTDKEPVQSSKRASVLSLLPWKFNKNPLLLENVEGQLPESEQSLGDPSADGADKSNRQSCPMTTESSVSSSSPQMPIPDGPSSLTDIPLQSDNLFPEPTDLPPPPNWIGEVNESLCLNGPEPFPFNPPAGTLSSVPPNSFCEKSDEVSPLPPPPEDFF